jgi:hypothetical protein
MIEQLIRAALSNSRGQELMDELQIAYGDRISYQEGLSSEDVAFREGERNFFQMLKTTLEDNDNE